TDQTAKLKKAFEDGRDFSLSERDIRFEVIKPRAPGASRVISSSTIDQAVERWHRSPAEWAFDTAPCIPVWRGCPGIPGLAEVVPARRRALTTLLRLLDAYRRSPNQPVSALITAPPGSGKSFLMEQIRRFLDIPLSSINLSQLLSFAELREELSRVEAVVSEDKQSKRIVFVDEVNARI